MLTKNSKITYKIDICKEAPGYYKVSFTILGMDERFRSSWSDDREKSYTAKNGMVVESAAFPELVETVFLRGTDKDKDNDTACKWFETYESASQYSARVNSALTEWAENWEGFKEKTKSKGLVEIPNRIKYSLERRGTGVVFCIYAMNEKFRATDRLVSYATKNGMTVTSVQSPDMDGGNIIWLRGKERDRDFAPGFRTFKTIKQAKGYITKVNEAIADWAENWEGFKEVKCKHCEELKKENEELKKKVRRGL